MFKKLPEKVTLIEVGPRDGLQFESKILSTNLKLQIINDLINSGIKQIQVTSFVNPKRVPQMADARELSTRLNHNIPGIRLTALALNPTGVHRAHDAGFKHLEVSISASNAHSLKNAGIPLDQAIENGKQMIRLAKQYGINTRAGIQCAFGCAYQGPIPQNQVIHIAKIFIESGADALAISDTTGMADPFAIKTLLRELTPLANNLQIILHLHDTRGLGLVNLVTAMNYGVSYFDTSVAGMGGCPFVPGAAGNIPTEDTAWLLKTLNIKTGINIRKLIKTSLNIQKIFSKRFPGKLAHTAANKSVNLF